jgi:hypothetical protein
MDTTKTLHPLAVNRAAKEPLPGPLGAAFGPQADITVGHLKVRPVVAYDYVILKEIGSPIYEQIFEQPGSEFKLEFTTEQACELCYLFTSPLKEVKKILRRSRDDFAELATAKFFDDAGNLKLVRDILEAVAKQMATSISTMQSYTSISTEEGKEGEVNFTQATVDCQKTDSVGSSPTSQDAGNTPAKA